MTTISKLVLIFRPHDQDLSTEAGRSRDRYRRAALSSTAAIASRVISLVVSLITVPLTFKYLGVERYGMWMTISSMVAMFAFADLGMSNGLINFVADASGRDNQDAIRRAVASAFWILSVIAFVLILVMAIVYPFLPWYRIFNVHSALAMRESGPALLALTACFAVNLPLGIVASIQNGLQNGFISNIWAAVGSLISLAVLLITIHQHAGLPLLIIGLSGAPVLASILNAGQLFLFQRRWLLPRISSFSKEMASALLKTGVMFFCMQLAMAVGYQSDNLVIAHIVGAKAVAGYAVPSRLFNILTVLVGMITSPMWPAYAHALAGGDIKWIRKTFRANVIGALAISLVVTAALVFFGNEILSIWVGPGISVSLPLLAAFGVRCVLSAYLQPLSFLLNGIGKVRPQAIIAVLMSVINLGLSILLVKHLGIIGAILGTVISELIVVVIPSTIIAQRSLKQLEMA